MVAMLRPRQRLSTVARKGRPHTAWFLGGSNQHTTRGHAASERPDSQPTNCPGTSINRLTSKAAVLVATYTIRVERTRTAETLLP